MSWSLRRMGRVLGQLLSVVVSPYPSSRYSRTSLSISELIFTLLTLQPFDFLAATVYLSLIPVNLLLLLVVAVPLPLRRSPDGAPGAEPKPPATGCPYPRMPSRRAN